MTPTKEQQRNLKTQAHHLKPQIQIGKNGLTPQQIDTINTALENHELIKIKFNHQKTQKEQLTQEIITKTESEQINLMGNTLTIYKENPEK